MVFNMLIEEKDKYKPHEDIKEYFDMREVNINQHT